MVSNPRYLIDQMRVKWLTKVSMRQLKNWKMRMSIKVNTRCWKPKQPQRPELEWDQDGGTLTEVVKICSLYVVQLLSTAESQKEA